MNYFRLLIMGLSVITVISIPPFLSAAITSSSTLHHQMLAIQLPPGTTQQTQFSQSYFYNNAWRYEAKIGSLGTGKALLQLNLPKQVPQHCALGPNACYQQSVIRLSSSHQPHALQQCLIPKRAAQQLSYSIINRAQQWVHYMTQDAGMMHQLSVQGYAVRNHNTCRVMELLISKTGSFNASNQQSIVLFKRIVSNALNNLRKA